MPESRDCENFICNVQFSVSSDRITCKMKSKIEIETNDIKITNNKTHLWGVFEIWANYGIKTSEWVLRWIFVYVYHLPVHASEYTNTQREI